MHLSIRHVLLYSFRLSVRYTCTLIQPKQTGVIHQICYCKLVAGFKLAVVAKRLL